ncbi:hypothetical protein K438DRAFT_181795 [Mycena galopus ATCC 62051]|nr:hypothetical protein K438DRAFT_181795 [Mycena galopus ATCC 62051]
MEAKAGYRVGSMVVRRREEGRRWCAYLRGAGIGTRGVVAHTTHSFHHRDTFLDVDVRSRRRQAYDLEIECYADCARRHGPHTHISARPSLSLPFRRPSPPIPFLVLCSSDANGSPHPSPSPVLAARGCGCPSRCVCLCRGAGGRVSGVSDDDVRPRWEIPIKRSQGAGGRRMSRAMRTSIYVRVRGICPCWISSTGGTGSGQDARWIFLGRCRGMAGRAWRGEGQAVLVWLN